MKYSIFAFAIAVASPTLAQVQSAPHSDQHCCQNEGSDCCEEEGIDCCQSMSGHSQHGGMNHDGHAMDHGAHSMNHGEHSMDHDEQSGQSQPD